MKEIKDVPVALFVGKQDDLGNINDARWLKDQIEDTLVFYEEFDASHASFTIGADMSFFDRVVQLVHYYNPM